MAIPNTTPTPNELFNGEMPKMTDTELRIVLVVTRATLGWEIDLETGMRKPEDWISSSQLMKKTGRRSAAISKSIDSCIKNGWIEARNSSGELLNTKNKRLGKKIFYRLGSKFMDRIKCPQVQTSSESEKVGSNLFGKRNSESEISESELYKRNLIQKKNYTKSFTYLEDKDFSELWQDWLEVRKKLKAPNTVKALELALKKLHKETLISAMGMLEQSIERGWRGVFPLKEVLNGRHTENTKRDRCTKFDGIGTEV